MHFMLTWLLVRRLELRFNLSSSINTTVRHSYCGIFLEILKTSLPRKTLQIFRIPFIKSFKITRFSAFI